MCHQTGRMSVCYSNTAESVEYSIDSHHADRDYHAQWANTTHHWFIDQNSHSTLQACWYINDIIKIGMNQNIFKLVVVTCNVICIVISGILKLYVNEMCYT